MSPDGSLHLSLSVKHKNVVPTIFNQKMTHMKVESRKQQAKNQTPKALDQ